MQKIAIITLLSLLALTQVVPAQRQDVKVSRVEVSAPWTGFYYEGQGQQLWAKAVVSNNSDSSITGATLRFEFFDPLGTRGTYESPLPVVEPAGVTTVESPQWWDYSGAAIGCKATLLKDGQVIAEGQTGGEK